MIEFDLLTKRLKLLKMSANTLAKKAGVSSSKLSRGRRGLSTLPIADQMKIQEHTGITPADWADFYVKLVKAKAAPGPKPLKKNGRAEVQV